MTRTDDGDYVLGTGDDELARLGLQHRVWRSTVLECWRRAGINVGSRVVDVGAGPGYATVDLAEIVGPTGKVVAVERSVPYADATREACRIRGLRQVEVHELDLMTDDIPATGMDAAWCRWVAIFVPSPEELVVRIARTLRPGGVAIFHDYVDYSTFQFVPRNPLMEEFVREVRASWEAGGGDPDVARRLPALLAARGFRLRTAEPRIMCARPGDYVWRWPATFVGINLDRLVELGRVDTAWADAVRASFAATEADPDALMITPLVLELVAERLDTPV